MTEDKTNQLSPSSVLAFKEALDGGKGALDAWLECSNEAEVRAHVLALVAAERERCARAVVDYSLSYPFDENDRSMFAECAQYVRDGVLPKA